MFNKDFVFDNWKGANPQHSPYTKYINKYGEVWDIYEYRPKLSFFSLCDNVCLKRLYIENKAIKYKELYE